MAVYALGDLHGHLDILRQVQEFIGPEDKVIFVGDACDRGPESLATIKALKADHRFIHICGNHEDMLVEAIGDYLDDDKWDYKSYNLCYINGGEETIKDWEWDADRMRLYYYLKKLPTHIEYVNENGYTILLSHAGYTPYWDEAIPNNKELIIPDRHHLIWNRDDYFDNWDPYNEGGYDNFIVVHGHTPTRYLARDLRIQYKSGPIWYADGHKVCIDTGGFFSGEFCLLNLDTYETKMFYSK
jgi:serine/threonine protein phosphatase 1